MDEHNDIQLVFTIAQINEKDQILNLIENHEPSLYCDDSQNFQEQCNIKYLYSRQMSLHSMEKIGNSSVENFPGKTLNINENLEELQKTKFVEILQKHSYTCAWEYTYIKGIDPKTCMHHIYIEENGRPVRKPQRRMNRNLKKLLKNKCRNC